MGQVRTDQTGGTGEIRYDKIQGWDSSTFTWISVGHKLKSVVDDNHFHEKKCDGGKKEEEIRSNPSPYLACPHSVVF